MKPHPPRATVNAFFPRLSSCLTTLLLGDTDSPTPTTSGLGVLTTHTETPVVTETTVSTDLLQALEIITKFGVNTVRENLAVLAIDNVLLPVQEPRRDFVLRRVLDDRNDAFEFVRVQVTSTA